MTPSPTHRHTHSIIQGISGYNIKLWHSYYIHISFSLYLQFAAAAQSVGTSEG